MEVTDFLKLIGSRVCACGGIKQPRKLSCADCWNSLPAFVQKPLVKLYGDAVKLYVRDDRWKMPEKLGEVGEHFFILYEAAIDWFTWTPERAWANAKFYDAQGREF